MIGKPVTAADELMAHVQTYGERIEALEAERDRYRKALAFYADEHAYTSSVPHDRGRTARAALNNEQEAR